MASTEWKPATDRKCNKCGSDNVIVRTVTSFDEAYDDDNFKCNDCAYSWWVDGVMCPVCSRRYDSVFDESIELLNEPPHLNPNFD